MARKLKIYQTSQGFFDLAIAAPSMKAALEAWGANQNLFHQGFAREADDPALIAVALARPGTVLKRPVGTSGPYREQADLPKSLPITGQGADPVRQGKTKDKSDPGASPPADEKAALKAALAYEKEQLQRERARKKDEAAAEKRRQRREEAIDRVKAAIQAAERDHQAKVDAIDKERAALDARAHTESDRWDEVRERLNAALRKAKE